MAADPVTSPDRYLSVDGAQLRYRDTGNGPAVVLVHDRYQNYDAIPGVLHQLCCQHILRDLEDAAQSYPDAVWPGQAMDALRALIHAANTARDKGFAAVPDGDTAADVPP